ncbi:MAG: exodeoxyribonuclease VII small subunit [Cyclobacteriaceae bacterium]|jgi:exodeoxyribonuclease VII small subunit
MPPDGLIDEEPLPAYRDWLEHNRPYLMTTKKSYPFEQSLVKLENLVEKMEAGDLTLEDSLKTFEEGIRLTRECQQALSQAEQKVKMLIEENGQLESRDLAGLGDD